MADREQVRIFDTTLRDGEQSPGVSLTVDEKLEIARQLAALRVDIIEAGFPITSQGDFESVRRIGREVKGPVICALARTKREDIERAAQALEGVKRPRIHVFTSSSAVHLEHMLRKSPDEVVDMSVEMVKLARNYTDDVEFSAQDTARSEPEFLYRLYAAAIEAGATTINIPDTVGYAIPEEFADLVRRMRENVPGADQVAISVHCHDDLGLAVANSLAAVRVGARQVEVTMNGIGERAGNTSLEEVVMAIHTRTDFFHDVTTGIKIDELYRTSRLVSTLTGMPVQPNKAIVGDNAFSHEAGIHQDGVLKEVTTYEIMRPEDIGWPSNRLVLGKHSGRHAFRSRLEEMGYSLTDEELNRVFTQFKNIADRKKDISDRDIEAIIHEEIHAAPDISFTLEYFHVSSGNSQTPVGVIGLRNKDGELVKEAALGDGPVDALCQAVDRATAMPCLLVDYNLKAVTGGTDALGEVSVRIEHEGRTARGRAVSPDILEASVRAYLDAVNKIAGEGTSRSAGRSDESRQAI